MPSWRDHELRQHSSDLHNQNNEASGSRHSTHGQRRRADSREICVMSWNSRGQRLVRTNTHTLPRVNETRGHKCNHAMLKA